MLLADVDELTLSADSITVNSENYLIAEGNVEVKKGEAIVKADSLTFNRDKNELKFENIIEFYSARSDKLSADEGILDKDLNEGIVYAANILIDEIIRIKADEIKFKNNQIYSASGLREITSCSECEGKKPNWYFTATYARRDPDNLNIIYRNLSLRIKGLPVVYFPYLRLPDPSVDRARGFLIPQMVLTSNLGSGVKLPYFIPLGDSADLLLPIFLPKQKRWSVVTDKNLEKVA